VAAITAVALADEEAAALAEEEAAQAEEAVAQAEEAVAQAEEARRLHRVVNLEGVGPRQR
jgi:hypothetical protein